MAANGFDGAFDDQNYGAEDMEEYKENEIEETKGEPQPVVSGKQDFSTFERILKPPTTSMPVKEARK